MTAWLDSGAEFSPCERYRYSLWRAWEPAPDPVDIGMRMLAPHELAAAQGFPGSYQLAVPFTYPQVQLKHLSKTAQIRMIGNSVCPPVAEAIVRAQFAEGAARCGGAQLGLEGVA